jgi:hypothetical protein
MIFIKSKNGQKKKAEKEGRKEGTIGDGSLRSF